MENRPDSTPAASPAPAHEFGYYAPMEVLILGTLQTAADRYWALAER